LKAGVARGVVLADAGSGSDGAFRACLASLGLSDTMCVQLTLSVWAPGEEPLPPKTWSGKGRPHSRVRRDDGHRPLSAKALALRLLAETWRHMKWREGLNQILSSRSTAVRLRPALQDYNFAAPQPVEWLVIEWPDSEAEPTKYWLSSLPEETPSKSSSTSSSCAGASNATTKS
jgi:SRSO17 transposase